MLGREAIAALIPHQGAMCLLERVVEWDQRSCRARHEQPPRCRQSAAPRRAAACDSSLRVRRAGHGGPRRPFGASGRARARKPGFLVSLRDVKLNVDFVDQLSGELMVSARRLLESAGSWQYSFEVTQGADRLATGRAAIMARAG